MKNIKNVETVNRMLSDLIEKARSQQRVVGKEFYDSGDYDGDADDFHGH